MIKNAVFDFGQVLCRFEPEQIVSAILGPLPAEDKALLCQVVFDRLYWDRLDAGAKNAEVLPAMEARLPRSLRPCAARILEEWPEVLPEMDGMRALLTELKKKGIKLYLLSNISVDFAARADRIPILSFFDGCIFSGLYRVVKPTQEIFDCLFRVCGILPAESVFIDDSQRNIEGAEKAGMQAFLFRGDAAEAGRFLYEKMGLTD